LANFGGATAVVWCVMGYSARENPAKCK